MNIIIAFSLFCIGVTSCRADEIKQPSPTPAISRDDAESRYAKHCLKSDVVTEAMLREFNDMSVERIDGFANGCEMENKYRK